MLSSQSMADNGRSVEMPCANMAFGKTAANKAARQSDLVCIQKQGLADFNLRRREIRTKKWTNIGIAYQSNESKKCDEKQQFNQSAHKIACLFGFSFHNLYMAFLTISRHSVEDE
jgi:CRISPR/Cas system CMR-associated protein Cmr3 (group 5 of RAMP superfamily)